MMYLVEHCFQSKTCNRPDLSDSNQEVEPGIVVVVAAVVGRRWYKEVEDNLVELLDIVAQNFALVQHHLGTQLVEGNCNSIVHPLN